MDERTNRILFLLLRSSIGAVSLTKEDIALLTPQLQARLTAVAKAHDMAHLLALGLQQNGQEIGAELKKSMFEAVYRSEQRERDFENVCTALSAAKIPFIPLKGAVLREYYPETWLRTSSDIDVLVRHEDFTRASSALVDMLGYRETMHSTHDVSFASPEGTHIELHFDLLEENRANNATRMLKNVWEYVAPKEDGGYFYEMTDAFFYFYHIAHMSKHFENGGCGIRPFIDLWILDRIEGVNQNTRDELLEKGNLLQFSRVARKLSEVWFGGGEIEDPILLKMQNFILQGGVYGSADNRVAIQQKRRGGRIGYLLSRIFLPYAKLKRYYPILEKHRWLMPLMQIRRWFMLLKPDVAKMAKQEMRANGNIKKSRADEMKKLLDHIGL